MSDVLSVLPERPHTTSDEFQQEVLDGIIKERRDLHTYGLASQYDYEQAEWKK